AAANETAYAAILEGMDEEVTTTLLRQSDQAGADEAIGRALERYLAALTADPEAAPAEERLLVLAAESLERGDIGRQIRALEDLIVIRPRSWRAHYILGKLRASYGAALHARGENVEAIPHYEAALTANGPAIVRLNLARALFETGDRERAAGELDALLESETSGEIAGQARRLRFGIRHADLEQALESAGRGAVEGDATRFAEARSAFDSALAAEPDLWEAHFGLGLLARHRGDAQTALASFARVLELWPEHPDALHELGVALLMTNDVDQAVGALERAAALRPAEPAYLADAGFAQMRAGDLAAARERLEHARTLDAEDPIT